MKTPEIPIETGRPPIEDSMSAAQALADEENTRVWLERQRKTQYRRQTPEAAVQLEALTLADAALRQLLIVFADPDVAAETRFADVLKSDLRDLPVAERLASLRRDLELAKDVVARRGTVIRRGTGEPV